MKKTIILPVFLLVAGCGGDLNHSKLSSAMSVRTDPATGCEYMLYHAGIGRGVTARIDSDGVTHKGCGENISEIANGN